MKADLHIHSGYSNDGELGIPEILNICKEGAAQFFSITDHNGIGGAREAEVLSADVRELRFIPGIEIDCNYRGHELHLLGYQIELKGDEFDKLEAQVERLYLDATPRIIENLENLGIEIDARELMKKSGGKAPTGEQMAEVLLENPEHRSHSLLQDYFPGGPRSDMPLINFYLDFLAQGKPAHAQINHIDFNEAVALIRDKGGIPIVAHPGLNFQGHEALVSELLNQGAMGLEVFNNYHHKEQTAYFANLVRKNGHWMTCGSDFHGKNKPLISIGKYYQIKEYRKYLDMSLEAIWNFKPI